MPLGRGSHRCRELSSAEEHKVGQCGQSFHVSSGVQRGETGEAGRRSCIGFYSKSLEGFYLEGCLLCEVSEVSEVAQSYPTLCDPMDCSLPGSSVHGIFQARVLEWVAIFVRNGQLKQQKNGRVGGLGWFGNSGST